MTTTPILALPELASAQAVPEQIVNENVRWLEFLGAGGGIVDRDDTAPPVSPSDGEAYLVAASATGAWAGHDGEVALYISTAWEFKPPTVGMDLYVTDEALKIVYNGATWDEVTTGGAYTDEQARDAIGTALVEGEGIDIEVDDGGNTIILSVKGATTKSETGTSYTAVLADKNKYIRFTNGSAVAFTIPPNSSVAFPVDTVITVEQAGAGTVTLTPGSGVTLHSRGALLATAGQYAVAQLKKVATDTWTVIGDVA